MALDRNRALTEQGPYDVILHKVDFHAGSIEVWSLNRPPPPGFSSFFNSMCVVSCPWFMLSSVLGSLL